MTEEEIYSLCETVAGITECAMCAGFYSGNSQDNIQFYITWAKEFQLANKDVKWGEDKQYNEEIDQFTQAKMTELVACGKARYVGGKHD